MLVHIKRTPNGKGSGAITSSSAATSEAKPPEISSSSTLISTVSAVVSQVDKSEVQTLKKRIDEMTKNMDALAEMVQKVSLQQQQAESELPGLKRKKLTSEEPIALQIPLPDGVFSAPMMDLDDMPLMDGVGTIELSPPAPVPLTESRESSLDENEFVDQLFTAFHEDEGLLGSLDGSASSLEEPTTLAIGSFSASHSNRPDPELMKRLSDALELLPKETQEMIVNRLIAAITSTDFLALGMPCDLKEQHQSPMPTPLAAATFAALLQHYTNQIKESNNRKKGVPSSSEEAQSSAKKHLQKTIPVIPVHA